jgi:sec-independent protein translocase protein TatB
MFDIGFSELMLIGVVALVVIGPERLPRVARTLGVLFGRMQRYVTQVKADIGREMEMADLGKVKSEFEDAARSFKSEIESNAAAAERDFREAQATLDRDLTQAAQGIVPAAAPGSPAAAASDNPAAAASDSPPAAAPDAAPEMPPSPQLELGIEEPAQPPSRPAP